MEQTEILYNGECPICSAEIAHYERAARKSGTSLVFTDLNQTDLSGWDLTPDQATRRIHARHAGQIISGFPAFLIVWRELPRMRWLARLLSLPGLRHAADFAYNRIAAPLLYALHKRRQRRVA